MPAREALHHSQDDQANDIVNDGGSENDMTFRLMQAV
jgi:hypothetical protein